MKKILTNGVRSQDFSGSSLIKFECEDENSFIATKPIELLINQVVTDTCSFDEYYPKKVKLQLNKRYPDDNADENVGPEKCAYVATSSFSELNEMNEQFDLNIGGVFYRVFINMVSNEVRCNEIVSYDYNGIVLLKNPVDKEMSEQLQKLFLEGNLPRNKRLDTIAHFKQKVEKFYNQQEFTVRSKKSKGNSVKVNLIRATLWCIKYHPKNLRYKRQTLLRAYKKFGEKTHTADSFIKTVRSKWTNLLKQYASQPEEFKKQNSVKIYAKNTLKIPRNTSEQKAKGNRKTFN